MGVSPFYRSPIADALFLLVFHRKRRPGDIRRRALQNRYKSNLAVAFFYRYA